MALYLLKRGPRPAHHNAPFHQVIICSQKWIARWEAHDSNEPAWIWENEDVKEPRGGWLLVRWMGFDIDYGGLVKGITLPDGTQAAFWRDYEHPTTPNVINILSGAVWWTAKKPIPAYLVQKGVVYPSDEFTRQRIITSEQEGDPSKFTEWKRVDYPKFWNLTQES